MNGEKRREAAALTARQTRLLAALLTSPSLGDAAKVAGVSERTARDWRRLPHFRKALADARGEALADATTRATSALALAVGVLTSIMQDTEAAAGTRLAAARAVLQVTPDLLRAHDLEQRIEALEERVQDEQPRNPRWQARS